MVKSYHQLISIVFSLSIIALAGVILEEFFPAIMWASVLAITTWPLYRRVRLYAWRNDFIAASIFIALVILVIAAPVMWLTYIASKEALIIAAFLKKANESGIPYPVWLEQIPHIGSFFQEIWDTVLGQPNSIQNIFAYTDKLPMNQVTQTLKSFTWNIVHRAIILGFTVMILFFLLKDGYAILRQIAGMGHYFVGDRWFVYSKNVPSAIKATVNGLVLVGIGVGIIMGGCYFVVGLPAPVIFACVTGVTAMIPLAVPFAFALVAIILVTQGKLMAAVAIIIIGTVVMFIADHFIRPAIIGNATRLPFLGAILGILGGVKAFGVIGLFIGPISMVLFLTLWHEADIFQKTEKEFIEQTVE